MPRIISHPTKLYFRSDDKKGMNHHRRKKQRNLCSDLLLVSWIDNDGRTVNQADGSDKIVDRLVGYKNEIATFCSAIRSGTPLRCGPEKAMGSAAACIRAFESHEQKQRLTLT